MLGQGLVVILDPVPIQLMFFSDQGKLYYVVGGE